MNVRVDIRATGNAEKAVRDLLKRVAGPSKVQVGFPAGSSGGILDRAVYNEFGTSRIPARPFMRTAFAGREPELTNMLRASAEQVLAGRLTFDQALGRLGFWGVGAIQDRITALDTPPNAPSTIRQKGSSNPLIDTGQMRQSVTWKLDDDDGS